MYAEAVSTILVVERNVALHNKTCLVLPVRRIAAKVRHDCDLAAD
jgi:hypothetical protein